jgi:hypothetical protein
VVRPSVSMCFTIGDAKALVAFFLATASLSPLPERPLVPLALNTVRAGFFLAPALGTQN